jgi:hypothetical protein
MTAEEYDSEERSIRVTRARFQWFSCGVEVRWQVGQEEGTEGTYWFGWKEPES